MDLNRLSKIEGLNNYTPKKSTNWVPLIAIVLVLGLWQALALFSGLPAFILPSPTAVAEKFIALASDGSLLWHTSVTLFEILMGLLSGTCSAILFGYAVAKSRTFDRLFSPFLVASQAVPIVAIAPLLVIWFGQGPFSKVLICALIVFFPVLVNTVVGLRAVPRSLNELMRSLHATRWQMLHLLEIPSALPIFLGGLKIGATLSVIGGVVGEFVGADKGLGFLISVGRGQYDTALVFVAIFTLVALALGLYGIVIYLEHRLLAWQEKN